MSYYFIDQCFPSPSEVAFFHEKESDWKILKKVRKAMSGHLSSYCPNPFSLDSRMILDNLATEWQKKISSPPVSIHDIQKIYWGILCPKISTVPLDEAMKERIRSIWRKDHRVAGIAKTLYELNNHRHQRERFYERKNMYTPFHQIQAFVEQEGLEIWTQEEIDLLLSAVLSYDDKNPSSSQRKGFRSLEDFQRISQDVILRCVSKTPLQMMDEWNQRSSIWLIGQEIQEGDKALLKSLYQTTDSPEELSEVFATMMGGEYYPDAVIQEFYDKELFSIFNF